MTTSRMLLQTDLIVFQLQVKRCINCATVFGENLVSNNAYMLHFDKGDLK